MASFGVKVRAGLHSKSVLGLGLLATLMVSCVLPRSSRGEIELMDLQVESQTNLSREGVVESKETLIAQQEGRGKPTIGFGAKDRPENLSFSEFPDSHVPSRAKALPLTSQDSETKRGDHGLIWPVVGRITSPFGMRRGRLHAGIDIYATRGTPIFASQSGQIILSGRRRAYGKLVVIGHEGELQTLYAHLLKSIVKSGQYVEQGQVIGYVGRTGRATGYHLHFETRVAGGIPQDPLRSLPAVRRSQATTEFGDHGPRIAYLGTDWLR